MAPTTGPVRSTTRQASTTTPAVVAIFNAKATSIAYPFVAAAQGAGSGRVCLVATLRIGCNPAARLAR